MGIKKNISIIGALTIGIFILSGSISTAGNYGRLKPDYDVKKKFESSEVDPTYSYYYYGPRIFPRALIGINKGTTLVADFWKPIDLTPTILRNWIWTQKNIVTWDYNRHGSKIIDASGNKIGVYYSFEDWKQRVTIRNLDENQIAVGAPFGGDERIKRIKYFGGSN